MNESNHARKGHLYRFFKHWGETARMSRMAIGKIDEAMAKGTATAMIPNSSTTTKCFMVCVILG